MCRRSRICWYAEQSIRGGDADAVVSTVLGRTTHVRMAPNLPAVEGKEAIRSYWKSRYDLYSVAWKDKCEDIHVIWAIWRLSGIG